MADHLNKEDIVVGARGTGRREYDSIVQESMDRVSCFISPWRKWQTLNWLPQVRTREIAPEVVRVSADFLLLISSLLAGKLMSFNNSNGISALWSPNFWSGHLAVVVFIAAVSVAIFMAIGVYRRRRRYVLKLLLVAVAGATAFLANSALALGIPALNIGQDTLIWAYAIALPLMICARLWSLVWRHVLAIEGAVVGAPTIVSTHPHARKTVLLIGGAGFIGSSLLPKLLQRDWHVRLLDAFLYGRDTIEPWLSHPNLEIIEADFRHVDSLVRAMQGISEVIHLGGIVGDPACGLDEELTIDINLAATRSIAEVAKGFAVRKLIFASSCSVYGANNNPIDESSELNPVSLYAKTKIASEKLLLSMHDCHFEPLILRFSTVYGISGRLRFDLVVNLLTARALIEGIITVLNGDQWRPFVHVDDVARAIMAFTDNTKNLTHITPLFNVGGNAGNYTIRQVAEVIKRVIPRAELVFSENDDDRRNYRVNFQKIRETIGFETRWTVKEGVRQVIQAMRHLNICNYSESRFSNVKALSMISEDVLSKPEPHWAQRLVEM